MDNPGFELLKQAFKQFADKHRGEDIPGRLVRTAAAGAKAVVDQGLREFPQVFVKAVVTDFYNLLTSQEVSDGISMTVRSMDEEKAKDTLDALVSRLKEDDVAMKIAKTLKDNLDKTTPEDLENAIDAALSSRSFQEQMMAKVFFAQARPFIEDIQGSSVEDVAQKIKDLADQIPTDELALQLGALTREVTPERVGKGAHDLVGKFASPNAVAEIVQGIGEAASDKLGRITGPADARTLLEEFRSEAADIVSRVIANDNVSKKTFKKDGGKDFAL